MGKSKKRAPPPYFATSGDWHKHHVILFDDLLNSPAFTALSAHAKEAYLILMQEYKGVYTGDTGDTVICPYSTFISKGVRAGSLSRALTQLEMFGFVDIESGGLGHQASKYHFSDRWKTICIHEDVVTANNLFKQEMDKRKLAKEVKKAFR